MARIRTIKPEFWTSEQVMECAPLTRLLFIGMWNFCDDHGRMPLSPKTIKAQVFPSDAIDSENVRGMIAELSSAGLILIYTATDGREYLEVTGWKHQRIDKPQKPKFPGPFEDDSTNDPGTFDAGKGKGREKEKKEVIRAVAVATRPSDASFDEFWKVFPRRDGANPKEPARKQFVAAVKSGVSPPEIIAAAGRYCAECRTKGQIGTSYVAQALTWLRQKRWVDYPAVTAVEAAPEALIEIMRESDDWPRWAELYRQHKGKDPPVNQRGGWHFPREWADEGQAA